MDLQKAREGSGKTLPSSGTSSPLKPKEGLNVPPTRWYSSARSIVAYGQRFRFRMQFLTRRYLLSKPIFRVC